MEDHPGKPLVGSGVTSPFALAGVWSPFQTHDDRSTYRLDPRWNLLLWHDGETGRWYVTCPDDLGYYVTPNYPYWIGPADGSPVGQYVPGPVAGASGTLTISAGEGAELSITALADDNPPTVDITGQWYRAGAYGGQDYFMQWGNWDQPLGPKWYLWWDSEGMWRITNELGTNHRTIDAWWYRSAVGPEDLTGNYGPGGDCQGDVLVMRL